MAGKKKDVMDQAAVELREVNAQIRELERRAKGLKADLISRFGFGSHQGFVIIERSRRLIDQDLLAEKFGDLEPFKYTSTSTCIEFPRQVERQSDAA